MFFFDNYYYGEPLQSDGRWQLLIDDEMIEDCFRLKRYLRRPVKYPHNPVLFRDKPWEGTSVGPCSVIWDEEYDCYRMWYRCANMASYHGAPGPPYYVCYAESDDALNWRKPILENCVPIPGHDRTNIIYTGTFYPRIQGPQVWKDEVEEIPKRRYKMISLERRPDSQGRMVSGVQMAYSPDGLQWSLDQQEAPLIGYHSDCQNHVVRHPGEDCWLLYCRPISLLAGGPAKGQRPDLAREVCGQKRHPGRRVAVATSKDLKKWSYPRTVLFPDEQDPPDIDQCIVFPSGNAFVMLYTAMEGDDTGRTEIKFAISGDGFHWSRFHSREPFICRGGRDAWDCGSVGTSFAPVAAGNRLLYFYTGRNLGQHEEGVSIGGIGAAFGEERRMVERVAGDEPGFLLSREFILNGNRLQVDTTRWRGPGKENAELRVEIIRHLPVTSAHGAEDSGDSVCPGYSLPDCDPVCGDLPAAEVSWNGNPDISPLCGEPVYLRFMLRNKGLCAFRITDEGEDSC